MPAGTPPVRTDAPGSVGISDYDPESVTFRWDEALGAFSHQYDRDLQLVCVWPAAREHDETIVDLAREHFTVLAEYDVTWSPEHVVTSFERLYGLPLTGTMGKHRAVGEGAFLLLVLEDPAPRYQYRRNVSGLVELTNVHVADLKRRARDVTGGYRVHSSNGLAEFFRDATLLLGPQRLDAVLQGTHPQGRQDVGDLVGTGGWASLEELFATLRRASPYVVLRSFEDLPTPPEDGEVDMLARDRTDLGAVAGARDAGTAALVVQVGGAPTVLDVRWVGDGYLDTRWEDHLLARRVWSAGGVAVPRVDDHFFSLLYHAKVQKPSVKPAYVPRLGALAERLALPVDPATVTEDETAAQLLDGYLSGAGYGVPRPADRWVHRNDAFVALLTRTWTEPDPRDAAVRTLWESAKSSRPARAAARSTVLRRAFHAVRSAVAPLRRRLGGAAS